ncbi:hypothetical protein KKF61_09080 [Patescibacteria group bacterium]|nr:hypothetical protein [Patescibacteria group bacterium]
MDRVDTFREPVVPGRVLRLEDVRGIHAGKLGVMFGKGPSLDSWDLPRRGDDVWATVNEAAKVILFPDYAFMSDCAVIVPLKEEGWHPPQGVVIVGKERRLRHMNDRDWLECVVGPEGTVLYYNPVPADVKGGSSPCIMLYIFKLMGIDRVLMVGFDAWSDPDRSSWSDKVNASVSNPRTRHDYGPSNESIARALRDTRIAPVWWHLEEDLVRELWHEEQARG